MPQPPARLTRGPANLAGLQADDLNRVLATSEVKGICELCDVDFPKFARIIRAVALQIIHEMARSGVRIKHLSDNDEGLAAGHVRENFGPSWQRCCELVARLLHQAPATERLVCERIGSFPAEAGRKYQGLGRQTVDGAGPTLRMIGTSTGRRDRHVRTFEMPLTTGMRHDHTQPDADHDAIAELAAVWGHPIAGTLAEHVDHILGRRLTLRRLTDTAISRGFLPRSFEASNIFAPWMIIESLVWGLPGGPTRKTAMKFKDAQRPGIDDAILQVVSEHQICAVLRAAPNLARNQQGCFELVDDVAETPLAHPPAFNVEYFIDEGDDMLMRTAAMRDGRGIRRDFWKIVNPQGRPLGDAIAAIEHEAEGVPWGCLNRHEEACRPGRVSAWEHEPSLVAAIVAADAACVEAERRRLRRR